jgi:hypothetical protein
MARGQPGVGAYSRLISEISQDTHIYLKRLRIFAQRHQILGEVMLRHAWFGVSFLYPP